MGKIVSLFRRQPEHGFEALVAPHIERLYRLAYRLCGNRADAEDLVQELLVRLYPKADELARLESPGPWLARSLYHLFIDTVRRNGRDPLHEAADESALALLSGLDTSSGEAAAERERLHRRLEAAMGVLTAEQRRLVALHDMEGYTLGLHRARARLRDALGPEPFCAFERVEGQRANK